MLWRRLGLLFGILVLLLLPVATVSAATAEPEHPPPPGTTATTARTVGAHSGSLTVHVTAPRAGKGSQLAGPNTYLFDCSYYSAQSWTSNGPTMQYWSHVDCSAGTPVRNVTVLKSAPVNTPTNFQVIASQPQDCSGGNSCESNHYPNNPPTTQLLAACAQPVVRGTDGVLYDFNPTCFSWPYNNQGAGYPNYVTYAPVAIPFPVGPYVRQYQRDDNFPDNIKAYYARNNWAQPSCSDGYPVEAHHIKPLFAGGDNSDQNGVLLCRSDHYWYNQWWNYGRFTPS